MREPIDIALIGIGGYGSIYVRALLDALPKLGGREFRLVGVADPRPNACPRLPEINALGIPAFSSPEALLPAVKPQLAVVSSPIQFHHDHVMACLAHGAHVLVEKPACASLDQAKAMLTAARRADLHVAVGFQWSFGTATHALKNDIRKGVLGRPLRLRTLVLWPRDEQYYARNGWAGRLHDDAGRPVFDSPVNNACAHFLHHSLYLLGDTAERSALPTKVRAELYRCKPIESFDTAAIRATTASGAEVLFLVSHATDGSLGPVFEYEFEHATITYNEAAPGGGRFVARFRDGRIKEYGAPPAADEAGKLFATLDALRDGTPSLCGIEAAIPHVAVTSAAHLSQDEITDFPPAAVVTDGLPGKRRTFVPGLDEMLDRCYREGLLPSEAGAPWATPGSDVIIGDDLSLRVRSKPSVHDGEAVVAK